MNIDTTQIILIIFYKIDNVYFINISNSNSKISSALKRNAAQEIVLNTQGQRLRNLRACRIQTGKVKVMGWSGETSGMCFSALYNINVQSKEESCDNKFISIHLFILGLQDYSQKYDIVLTSNSNKAFSKNNNHQKKGVLSDFFVEYRVTVYLLYNSTAQGKLSKHRNKLGKLHNLKYVFILLLQITLVLNLKF